MSESPRNCLSAATIVLTVICSITGMPQPIWAQCAAEWKPMNSGMDGDVRAAIIFNGQLVVGGAFANAGGTPCNNVARWDGATWQPLGTGVNGLVVALEIYNGELYVGGDMSEFIARWNGTSWQSVGGGVDYSVNSLTVHNGTLVVGGRFNVAGGVGANRIARWNGTLWQAIGTGMNDDISALTVHESDLIASGSFTTAGGNPANRIARWNGTTWQALGSGMSAGNVYTLIVHGGELYAGGGFDLTGGPVNIAKWNGADWDVFGGGTNDAVSALGVFQGDLVIGGGFDNAGGVSAAKIARRVGSTWQPFGSGLSSSPFCVVQLNNDLIIGGIFTTAGGVSASRIARWTVPGKFADMLTENSPPGCGPMPCTPIPATAVLGAPDQSRTNFNNVGATPGYVTVKFSGRRIENLAGTDVNVWIAEQEWFEGFRVLASQDCVNFVEIGIVPGALGSGFDSFPVPFDLSAGGLAWAVAIKVENLNIDGYGDGCCEGPDIDAIEAYCLTDVSDCDGDCAPDDVDPDDDNDGVADGNDACPNTPNCTVDVTGRPKLDMNNDCSVDGLDIQLIVNQLLNSCSACP